MTLREATPVEWRQYGRERPANVHLLWSCIVEEEGQVVGHGFISEIDGMVWSHDLEHWGKDKTAVARMFVRGRKFLRDSHIDELWTHVKPGSATHEFYLGQGWQEGELVLRGTI